MTSPAATLDRGEFKNEPIRDFSKPENRAAMEAALKKVGTELGREYPLIIGGEKSFTKEKTQSTNPSHPSQVVGIFQKGAIELANQAIEAADKAFAHWKMVPAAKRAWYCFEVAEILRKRRFEMNAWLCYETGKTWTEADADTAELIDFCEFYAREMLRLAGPQKLVPNAGENNHLVYIPLGVGIVIPPWNFAAAIMGGMTLAAIVTGNTVVVKPSSDSPTVAAFFMEILNEAGLPKGVVNFFTGPGSTAGDALVSHPKTRFIAFTGSMEVGLRIGEI
ncbi:MAG: aldehyde dehydrogenase family protein, partial [Candidatus Acidiferrales bacterium]